MASLAATGTERFDVFEQGYSFPVTPANRQVMLYTRQSSGEIIGDFFDGLVIQGDSKIYIFAPPERHSCDHGASLVVDGSVFLSSADGIRGSR